MARRIDGVALAFLVIGLLFAAASGTCTVLITPSGPSVPKYEAAYNPVVWYFGGLIFGGCVGVAALSWRRLSRDVPPRSWRTAVDCLFACAFSALSIGYGFFAARSAGEIGDDLGQFLIMLAAPAIGFGWVAYRLWRRIATAGKIWHD